MRILSVADTVCEKLLETQKGAPYLPDISLIVSCGDLPPEYLTSLRARYDAPLFYVLGNHDLRYQTAPPVGCRLVDRRLLTHQGLRITGFSGSRWYNGNINQYTEREMSRFVNRMRFTLWRSKGCDLIITHAPPRYIHDEEDRCHRGFQVFRKLIERYGPSHFLHGHIHKLFDDDRERTTLVNTTKVVNCYGYYTFDIKADGVS